MWKSLNSQSGGIVFGCRGGGNHSGRHDEVGSLQGRLCQRVEGVGVREVKVWEVVTAEINEEPFLDT